LLRDPRVGPGRGHEVVRPLEGQACTAARAGAVVGADGHPVVALVAVLHLPAEQVAVEAGEGGRVGGVERDDVEADGTGAAPGAGGGGVAHGVTLLRSTDTSGAPP